MASRARTPAGPKRARTPAGPKTRGRHPLHILRRPPPVWAGSGPGPRRRRHPPGARRARGAVGASLPRWLSPGPVAPLSPAPVHRPTLSLSPGPVHRPTLSLPGPWPGIRSLSRARAPARGAEHGRGSEAPSRARAPERCRHEPTGGDRGLIRVTGAASRAGVPAAGGAQRAQRAPRQPGRLRHEILPMDQQFYSFSSSVSFITQRAPRAPAARPA